MSIQFNKAVPNPHDTCAYCKIKFFKKPEKPVLAHLLDGKEVHHLHRDCLTEWLIRQKRCPFCFKRVDAWPLFSWKQKTIVTIRAAGQNPFSRYGIFCAGFAVALAIRPTYEMLVGREGTYHELKAIVTAALVCYLSTAMFSLYYSL